MTINDLVQLAADRADAWNLLWQLFIAVSTTLLAIVTASSKPLSKPSSIIICVGFSLFLIGNFRAFQDYYAVRSQIQKIIYANKDNKDEKVWGIAKKEGVLSLAKEMGPPPKILFISFYWILGLTILSGLWYIPYRRRKNP